MLAQHTAQTSAEVMPIRVGDLVMRPRLVRVSIADVRPCLPVIRLLAGAMHHTFFVFVVFALHIMFGKALKQRQAPAPSF